MSIPPQELANEISQLPTLVLPDFSVWEDSWLERVIYEEEITIDEMYEIIGRNYEGILNLISDINRIRECIGDFQKCESIPVTKTVIAL